MDWLSVGLIPVVHELGHWLAARLFGASLLQQISHREQQARDVRAHVQECFDHERALCALVDAAETMEALEEIAWTE